MGLLDAIEEERRYGLAKELLAKAKQICELIGDGSIEAAHSSESPHLRVNGEMYGPWAEVVGTYNYGDEPIWEITIREDPLSRIVTLDGKTIHSIPRK